MSQEPLSHLNAPYRAYALLSASERVQWIRQDRWILPVHDLSAVNDCILRFKYSSTTMLLRDLRDGSSEGNFLFQINRR